MFSLNFLKERLSYNPESGEFLWLNHDKNKRKTLKAGTLAKQGYVRIMINYRYYMAHKLAWFYMTGMYPIQDIDHIDNNKNNNSWINLRLATKNQNQHNTELPINNSSGIKGISLSLRIGKSPAYKCHIMCNRKTYSKSFTINYYISEEAALNAAKIWIKSKREELHKEFTNHG